VRLQRVATHSSALPIALFVGIAAAIVIVQPSSGSEFGTDLLLQAALPLVLVSLAQMFVVLGGDFDLGIGSAVGLTSVLSATLLVTHPVLGVIALCGIPAGYVAMSLLAERTGVSSVVITLGASFVWLGIALMVQSTPGGSSPTWMQSAFDTSLPGLPEPVYLMVLLAIIPYLLLRHSRYGVVLRGYGGNRSAIANLGRSPLLARAALFALAGLFVVLAGLATTFVSGGSDANASAPLTISSFGAVVLGGAVLGGGRVDSVGVVAAALALSLISSLLGFLNVSATWNTGIEGMVILGLLTAKYLLVRGVGRK
jgi:ribose/xylose/arabinose/galactoside ABC-type transport system permease subunit